MDEPEACARLLKHYIEDVVTRLTPMEHGEATRPRRLTPIPPAPHTAFFAKGGPFQSVLNREGSRKKSGSPTEKGPGAGSKKEMGSPDGVPTGAMMVTPDPKPKRDKGPCMWAACKALGVTTKDGTSMSGCTAPDCTYSHLPGADAYQSAIRKEHIQQWTVTPVLKSMLGAHIPGFKPEWAEKPGAQGGGA